MTAASATVPPVSSPMSCGRTGRMMPRPIMSRRMVTRMNASVSLDWAATGMRKATNPGNLRRAGVTGRHANASGSGLLCCRCGILGTAGAGNLRFGCGMIAVQPSEAAQMATRALHGDDRVAPQGEWPFHVEDQSVGFRQPAYAFNAGLPHGGVAPECGIAVGFCHRE